MEAWEIEHDAISDKVIVFRTRHPPSQRVFNDDDDDNYDNDGGRHRAILHIVSNSSRVQCNVAKTSRHSCAALYTLDGLQQVASLRSDSHMIVELPVREPQHRGLYRAF